MIRGNNPRMVRNNPRIGRRGSGAELEAGLFQLGFEFESLQVALGSEGQLFERVWYLECVRRGDKGLVVREIQAALSYQRRPWRRLDQRTAEPPDVGCYRFQWNHRRRRIGNSALSLDQPELNALGVGRAARRHEQEREQQGETQYDWEQLGSDLWDLPHPKTVRRRNQAKQWFARSDRKRN
jgi:hypothetical protein